MIHQFASCDAPGCPVSVPTEREDQYPDSWLVIQLQRARGGLNWPTGLYGFHSQTCLTTWTLGRPMPKAATKP